MLRTVSGLRLPGRRLAISLSLALSLGALACDGGADAPAAKGDAKAKGDAEGKGDAEPEADAKPEAASCSASISVTGAQSFATAELSASVGLVERKGEQWISLQANELSGSGPRYTLMFFTPEHSEGKLSFYDDARAMNLLTLQMMGGPEFSAFETREGGGDPGSFEVSKPREGWVELHGKAKLTSDEAGEIELQLDVSTALPPAKCP